MTIIVYPADNWNSFGDQAEIEALIAAFTPASNWSGLNDDQKQAYLIQATMMIAQCDNIKLPDDTTENLKTAEAIIANYLSTVYNSEYDASGVNVTKEKVGELEQQYKYGTGKNDPTVIPPQAIGFLKPYGCNTSTRGFSQSYVGRS